MPQIHIARDAGKYVDRRRAYRVMLDGEEAGRLSPGQSVTLTTDPGRHRLHFQIDWCRSRYEALELREEETVNVRCWPNAHALTALFFVTLGWARYIGFEVGPGGAH